MSSSTRPVQSPIPGGDLQLAALWPSTDALLEATSQLIESWARTGSTDVLPPEPEWAILAAFSRECAATAWAEEPRFPYPEQELLALGPLATRSIALLDPHAGLRFAGAVQAVAGPALGEARAYGSGGYSYSYTYGHYGRQLRELRSQHPLVVRTDIASCYPSLQLQNPLVLPWFGASLAGQEHRRLGLTGLPVGGDESRRLAEIVLAEAVDRPLKEAGYQHVRYMDDIWVGVDNQRQAQAVLAILSVNLASKGLTLNKSKTRLVRSVDLEVEPRIYEGAELRTLLEHGQDRVGILMSLAKLRRAGHHLQKRERQRWIKRLARHLERLPGSTVALLRTLLALSDGNLPEEVRPQVLGVLKSPFSVTRAVAMAELSAIGLGGLTPIARQLAITDPSGAARREAIFALVRAGDISGIRALAGSPPRTGAERTARIVALGALGLGTRGAGLSLFEQLLHEAARLYGRGPALRQHRRR